MYAITAESVDDAHDWVLEIRARVRYHAKDRLPSRAAAMVPPPAVPTAAAAATAVAVRKPETEGGASRSVTTQGPGPRSVLNRHGDARPVLRLFPPCALISHVQRSCGVVDNMPFVWCGHTKSLTTRARPSPDLAVRLE